MQSFKKHIDEAVEIRHDRYMRSHGKKASGGHGMWMFTHKDRGDVDYNNNKEVHTASGKFSDAAKSAKAWAKKNGHSAAYVMESSEELNEDLKKAAAELKQYAKKYGGIDKKDFMKSAGHMEKGDHAAIKKHLNNLDTDPRDKIVLTLHKHGNDVRRYGYEMREEVQMDEAAPKMKGDWLKKEREKNREHDAAMGRTPTGRKKPVRQMTSTQKSLASMRKEEVELDEAAGYKATSEKSKFGGHRPHLKNPDGKTSYLSGTSYKTAKHAAGEAQAYHDGYFNTPGSRASERGAERAVHAYRQKNKEHLYKKESVEMDEAVGTSAKYAGKSGFMGGKYTSNDRMMDMKNFSATRDKRAAQRDAEHQKQDPKMAKAGYAKHMVDVAKAAKKAAKRGVDSSHLNWKHANGIKREEFELDEDTINKLTAEYINENNITLEELENMSEAQLNELIGKAIGGAFKVAAKTVVGAGRLAKKAANRMSTAGRADAAEKKAEAQEKKNADRERIRKAQERLRKAREAANK